MIGWARDNVFEQLIVIGARGELDQHDPSWFEKEGISVNGTLWLHHMVVKARKTVVLSHKDISED